VNGALATAVIVAALALAAWGGLTALLDRPTGPAIEAGAALVEVGLLALTAVALVDIAGGARPAEPGTFAGYLITTLALLPVAVIMARMEPTRWGSAMLGGGALVVPVLILRLQQVYG
jgi:hypothetical protein